MAVILPSRDAVAFSRCADLARQVAARGWDVLTVEPRPAARPDLHETGEGHGVRQFVLDVADPAPFLGDTPSESLLCALFADRPVDAIHLHLAGALADPAIMERGWLLGIPLIASVHAGWHPPPGEPAQVYLTDQFTRADLVCVADHRGLQADWLDPGSPVLDHSSARAGKGWADVYGELTGDVEAPGTGLTMSVVVTTEGRSPHDCLAALCRQTLPADRFQVLVVDDGAAGPVAPLFRDRLDLTLVPVERHADLAAARNAGVEAAGGDILCFLDAGDEPASRCLAEHLRTYAEHGDDVDAVLGWTGPTADMATSVEAWLAFRGLVYMSHEGLRHLSTGDWYQFWGRRYSIRRTVLGGMRFEVRDAEDADLAYRLAERPGGLRVVHNRHAVQRVRAGLDPLSLIHRAGRIGQARARLAERHPSLRTHPAFRGSTYEATARKLARRTDARLRLLTSTWPVAIEDLRALPDPHGRGTLLDRMHSDLVTVNSIEVSLGWLLAGRRSAAEHEHRPLRIGVSALSPLLADVARELAAAPAGSAVLVVGVPPGYPSPRGRIAGDTEVDVLACDDADDLWRACDVVCSFTPVDGHDPHRHAMPLPRGTIAATLRDLLGTRELAGSPR